MIRGLLLKIAPIVKMGGVSDLLFRYNPLILARVARICKAAQPETILLPRVLKAAHKTRYGKGKPQQLEGWPLLTKASLRAAQGDFITRGLLPSMPTSTGGTTGVPLKLWRSAECVVAEQYFIDKLLAPHGFTMRDRVAVLRADTINNPKNPHGRLSHGGKRLTLSMPLLNGQTVAQYHAMLTDFAPQVLWVYPSAILSLKALLEAAGLSLSVPVILASSENLSGEMHLELERFFGAKLTNYYGQAERVCFAHSLRPGEFYFEPAYGKVELLPVPGESTAFRVIATNYWNKAMPLVRYDTNDLIHVAGPCGPQELAEIAAGTRPFATLAGRDNEYFLTREGVKIIGLNHIPKEVQNVVQIQLIQPDYQTLKILVLALPGCRQEDLDKVLANAKAKLPANIQITVEKVMKLRMLASGKTPFVIREFAG